MIITINGDHGSGKSTIAKKLAEKLRFEHFSAGDFYRAMAQERGMTLLEILELGEKDPSIDKEVDDRTKKIGIKKDNFIMDSRLAWHFIPNSIKILLKVDEEEGAKRMIKANGRDNEDKNRKTIGDIIQSNRRRLKTDNKRYEMYYNLNVWDKENYDFVLDTTDLDIEEVLEKVLEFVKSKNSEEK